MTAIRKFFDTVPRDLLLKAVAAHTDQPWVLLYVERWLKAPLQLPDGTLRERDRGTHKGPPWLLDGLDVAGQDVYDTYISQHSVLLRPG